jgi:SHOCT-like protein
MADVEKILNLVAQGALTPEEADEILTALNRGPEPAPEPEQGAQSGQSNRQAQQDGPRHLRIQVTERGRAVVNLRVPMNIAGWASAYIPGLSDENANRIRGAIASGVRGPIIDIGDGEDRVLITSE